MMVVGISIVGGRRERERHGILGPGCIGLLLLSCSAGAVPCNSGIPSICSRRCSSILSAMAGMITVLVNLPTPVLLHPRCRDGRGCRARRLPRQPLLLRPPSPWLSSRSSHWLMSERLPRSRHWWPGLHRLFPTDHWTGDAPSANTPRMFSTG
jgi:hypothetical protein